MAVILFGVFIALLLLGVPVAFAICSAAATTMFAGFGDAKMMIVVQRMFASCDSFSLIAVPFFIFAGDLLAGGRISKVLVEFCESLLGMIKGGLSVVSVLAGMFFAAISGSGAATTAAVGATLVPELKKRGYREDSAAALVAAAGTIGVVIPPSVPMVLYAVIAEESVSRLFSAGFLPGVIMGMMLIAIALYQAYQNNYPKGAPFSLKNVGKTFLKAIPGILMPAIILGGIFSGYFTPSEAAAVAVVYALLVSTFVYRDMADSGSHLLRRAERFHQHIRHPRPDFPDYSGCGRVHGDVLRNHYPDPGFPAAGACAGHFHPALRHPLCGRHRHRHDYPAGRHQPVRGLGHYGAVAGKDIQGRRPLPHRPDRRLPRDCVSAALHPRLHRLIFSGLSYSFNS